MLLSSIPVEISHCVPSYPCTHMLTYSVHFLLNIEVFEITSFSKSWLICTTDSLHTVRRQLYSFFLLVVPQLTTPGAHPGLRCHTVPTLLPSTSPQLLTAQRSNQDESALSPSFPQTYQQQHRHSKALCWLQAHFLIGSQGNIFVWLNSKHQGTYLLCFAVNFIIHQMLQ